MNPIRRSRLRNQLRVAARLHAAGELSDAWYAAIVTHLMFELGGRVLKDGDPFGPLDFELAVPRALGLPTAYQWDSPELARRYGPYGQAPTILKNATGDYVWGAQAQGLYEATLPLVQPLPRFEAYVADVRKRYPTLTGLGAWLASLVVAGVVGGWIARLLTCP